MLFYAELSSHDDLKFSRRSECDQVRGYYVKLHTESY